MGFRASNKSNKWLWKLFPHFLVCFPGGIQLLRDRFDGKVRKEYEYLGLFPLIIYFQQEFFKISSSEGLGRNLKLQHLPNFLWFHCPISG